MAFAGKENTGLSDVPMEHKAKEPGPSLDFGGISQHDNVVSDQLADLAKQFAVRMERQEALLRKLSDQMSIYAELSGKVALPEEEGGTQDVAHLGKGDSLLEEEEEEDVTHLGKGSSFLEEEGKLKAIFKASQAIPRTSSHATSQLGGRAILNKWAAIVEDHPLFDRFICAAIVLNTIFVGVQLELTTRNNNMSPKSIKIVNYSFTSIFCIEILIRILAKGKDFFVSNPAWAWDYFDLSLVLVSLLESFMSTFWKSAGLPENPTFMRIIRVTRVLSRFTRLMRLLRLTRFLRSLRVMIKSLIFCFRSLVWVALLWFCFIYMFGIMFTAASSEYITSSQSMPLSSQQSDDLIKLQKSFGTLSTSMRTLYESVTGGHDWGETADLLRDVHGFWLALFLFYQFFSTFALMNVVTGVFCNGAIEGAQQDHTEVLEAHVASSQLYVNRFKALFRQIDTNNNGIISVDELEQHLDDEAVQAYFLSMDIQPHEAWTLMTILATESSTEIDFEEFILCCMRFRGTARAVDLASVSYQNRCVKKRLRSLGTDIRACRKDIHDIGMALELQTNTQGRAKAIL